MPFVNDAALAELQNNIASLTKRIGEWEDKLGRLAQDVSRLQREQIPFGTVESATSPGMRGQVKQDGEYRYYCYDTNRWDRAATGTW